MEKKMKPKKNNYSPASVISTQKRVLRMVKDVVSTMTTAELSVLRLHPSSGVISLEEMLQHVEAALNLRAKNTK